MCYGDVDYGKDGYYQRWIEERLRERQQRKEKEDPDARR
jgi:hypothetical protein